ncbi:dimethyl sulfoxide reductase anchor subunit family protein [Desulfitobacterium chlororespirans]|uniref:Anaerobic dimethyl sulfoxide reductase subunit C (DMSO reductase anchor subunit) n=1 Tax=Desulfitobacterium chlororespirans DSM 11544 TaxID=1121395 RepID=A0A1M7SZ85_9FIRM|nr:DmsC/YnfH family molybdoenzyme membrane anchor subunit [Desulfitobacterium chlororespirans]SHN63731.1 anaerobic dimethyl sulfoxide reductase subunit C (DMSO reductase anchor subunit) [Desulfitobacterium chlororespirans DSM 11544]
MSIEWSLVFFTVFVGLGCGIFVCSVILTEWGGMAKQVRTKSSLAALAALAIGGFSSVLHLGHPERIFGALGHPTSGIFMESTMLGLVALDIIVYLVAMRRNASDRTLRIISTVGIIPAVILAFAVGYTYVLSARPAWNTLILPLIYLASAGLMGCYSLSLLIAFTNNISSAPGTTSAEIAAAKGAPSAAGTIKWATLIAVAFQAVLLILYLIHLAVAPYPDITRSATRVLTGDLAVLFWGGLVLLGLLVPAALVSPFNKKKAKQIPPVASLAFGLVCVLVSSALFRGLMFSLGSSIKQFL